jgi:hypothetical protein
MMLDRHKEGNGRYSVSESWIVHLRVSTVGQEEKMERKEEVEEVSTQFEY